MMRIRSLFVLIILLAAVVCASCSDSTQESEENWLNVKCGQCHEQNEHPVLFAQAKAMSKEEFESALQGMVHEGIDFTEKEKSMASRIIDKLRGK